MQVNVRRFQSADLSALSEIYRYREVTENTSQLIYLGEEQVAQIFEHAARYTLVAEIDHTLVGHITLILSEKWRSKHVASVALAVHPQWHGQGIGRALLLEAIDQADNWLGLQRLELDVYVDNVAAIGLYESVGFVTEGVKQQAALKNGRFESLVFMARLHSL
ncbi:GNAT family N-acetyltransferase [Salinimonas lutimaris]|uniref:GNAT family N-acetyltransferase n=1 Tax=Salinimonas lutimaris TaxID=914153 RepID=UPI0010BFC98A|nr:GNAT family N-acetyltransferase [Salinimonas lutimaris]